MSDIKMIKKTPREKSVEVYLCEEIKKVDPEALTLKFVPTFFKGMTDRILLLPGGLIVFVECKKPKGGVISPRQKYVHERLTRLGFKVRVVKNKDEVDVLVGDIKKQIVYNKLCESISKTPKFL